MHEGRSVSLTEIGTHWALNGVDESLTLLERKDREQNSIRGEERVLR